MEVQHPVIAGDHDLAVDQERLVSGGGFDNSQEAVRPVMAVECEAAETGEPSRRTMRYLPPALLAFAVRTSRLAATGLACTTFPQPPMW